MDRQYLLELLSNFSMTVSATSPAEEAQTLTMLGSFLTTVQTTKLGAELSTVIADKVQSLADNSNNNGGQNL
jgi:hypothetical protein